MEKRKKPSFKENFVNFFGSLGYFTIFLQIFVALIAYFQWLRFAMDIVAPPQPTQPTPTPDPTQGEGVAMEPSIFVMVFAVVMALVCLGIVVYIIIRVPIAVSRVSSKVTRTTAERAAPVVLRAKKQRITKKKRLQLSYRLVLSIKLAVVLLLLFKVYVSQFLVEPLVPFSFILTISAVLAGLSIVFFTLQYGLGYFMNVEKQQIR